MALGLGPSGVSLEESLIGFTPPGTLLSPGTYGADVEDARLRRGSGLGHGWSLECEGVRPLVEGRRM